MTCDVAQQKGDQGNNVWTPLHYLVQEFKMEVLSKATNAHCLIPVTLVPTSLLGIITNNDSHVKRYHLYYALTFAEYLACPSIDS